MTQLVEELGLNDPGHVWGFEPVPGVTHLDYKVEVTLGHVAFAEPGSQSGEAEGSDTPDYEWMKRKWGWDPLGKSATENVAQVPAESQRDHEVPRSLSLLRESFKSRSTAELHPGVRGEQQNKVRAAVRDWMAQTYPGMLDRDDDGKFIPGTVEDYSPATERSRSMLSQLVNYLRANHPGAMSPEEDQATEDFLAANFALQESVRSGEDLSEGDRKKHAFVVPVRLSTKNPEYSDEARPLIPALHYLEDELVPFFMRDMPPFVADEYKGGGYLVVAPVTADMGRDLQKVSVGTFMKAGQSRVNSAVDTGAALGARVFGYGATLPGLMNWGRKTANKEAITTTGHGGTTALMCMLMNKAKEVLLEKPQPRIGILGAGAMGMAATEVIAALNADCEVSVFDPNPERMDDARRKAEEARGRGEGFWTLGKDAASVVEASDIIISTATTTFQSADPSGKNYIPASALKNVVVIDDSEPHSFRPDEVLKAGGLALDVIGRSRGWYVLQRGTDFGYGHTLANGRLDAFGCELEAAVLNQHLKALEAAKYTPEQIAEELGNYALTGPVTVEHTKRWIELFERYGIGPAPLQAFGQEY